MPRAAANPLERFHPAVRAWFAATFGRPTAAQALGWPPIARGESTLLLAPTGSGKTLAAFLACIDRVMFVPPPPDRERCRVLYVSPLKALAVDVERNLRAPLVGIAHAASSRGESHTLPQVAVRTGDTPANERARFARRPSDILITTPESLYLLLTSNAREALRSVDTVIIDEIHALVPTKRGAHLALSLERLQALCANPPQRIGLSATQRPLDEVARFLGGVEPRQASRRTSSAPGPAEEVHAEFAGPEAPPVFRPVTIVDAGTKKALELTIEVPVEELARLGSPPGEESDGFAGGRRGSGPPLGEKPPAGVAALGARPSIWAAIHPRLVELIRAHRSTLLFVNSRRIAERLAGAINELAGEQLAHAHHGSIAREQRLVIEDALKSGRVRALVATSSLELGIDMGAVDLVVQIEAPPSVASGMQRIGRAGHSVGETSRGVIFPKYRADLVACAAIARAMHDGDVESTRYQRNPLDLLAQQVVAMCALDAWDEDALFAAVRGAAPFADLSRAIFEGVLDLLSGRYQSDDFAELRPRLTWDRLTKQLTAREGARKVAVVNGGTIPDRGLYGVYLAAGARATAGANPGSGGEPALRPGSARRLARGRAPSLRIGELDEEMVFESRVGETFVLGASTWRIEEITHDRVLVSPAPGQPGKMPFWHGDQVGRPVELGRAIGKLVRELRAAPRAAALERLVRLHDLDARAAENLLQYLSDQHDATGAVPDDRTIVVERGRDELGAWRVCVLSPLGGRIHAPWSMALVARVKERTGVDVETLWTNDGFVVRFPESDAPPDLALILPGADEIEALVARALGGTALFAAKFREIASRALLLPRRRPGQRTPLWQLRKRASELLAVAARFPSFPMLLETYRECLRDVFDMPALVETLRDVDARRLRVVEKDCDSPSPFASSILFGFVANYIYDGDAPLAERRAQALSIDQSQLRELLGNAELRELLDLDALAEVEARLQLLGATLHARHADGVHDLLLRLGELSANEVAERSTPEAAGALEALVAARRAVPVVVAGERRFVAVEHAARYRDALGAQLPPGLPDALLGAAPDALGEVLRRYSRTHAPFTSAAPAARYGLARPVVEKALRALVREAQLLEGEFTPGETSREWCEPEVLRQIRRRSLAKLRHEVEPVEPRALGRFTVAWHGVGRPRAGLNALLDAIEKLQGAALPASLLERELLAARVENYHPGDLDALASAGEVAWCGVEPLGEHDGRVALYLTDALPRLWRPPEKPELTEREERLLAHLRERGASFFASLQQALGGGFPAGAVDALWGLVWKGLVTNDAFHALRAYVRAGEGRGKRLARDGRTFRSRRLSPPSGDGRWSLVESRVPERASPTQWSAAQAQQLLNRHGFVTREVAGAESFAGGFTAVYEVLKAMEEAGRVRRGYFVSGVGATQFALPSALDLLRTLRDEPSPPESCVLAAADPANPYGALLPWPQTNAAARPTRTVGAEVVLVNGAAAAWLGRAGRQLFVWLPPEEPDRAAWARVVATRLASLAERAVSRGAGMLVAEIDGQPARKHPLAPFLEAAGFASSAQGFTLRRSWEPRPHPPAGAPGA